MDEEIKEIIISRIKDKKQIGNYVYIQRENDVGYYPIIVYNYEQAVDMMREYDYKSDSKCGFYGVFSGAEMDGYVANISDCSIVKKFGRHTESILGKEMISYIMKFSELKKIEKEMK